MGPDRDDKGKWIRRQDKEAREEGRKTDGGGDRDDAKNREMGHQARKEEK